jgi:hypothetical protein
MEYRKYTIVARCLGMKGLNIIGSDSFISWVVKLLERLVLMLIFRLCLWGYRYLNRFNQITSILLESII